MNSLRGRIALSCALLLIAAIAILSLGYTLASRTILYDQTKQRVDALSEQITQFAERNDPSISLGGTETAEEQLSDTANLDNWDSPTTFVQVDALGPGGGVAESTPIGKSSNLGSVTIVPNPAATTPGSRFYREAHLPIGHVLIADQMLALPTGRVVLHVAEKLDLIDNSISRMQLFTLILVCVALPAVVLSSLLLSASVIKPIHELIAAMREIGSDRLDRRVGMAQRTDELGDLARTFDEMLDRLEASFIRERRFIADASHELKTPLTVINANAQMLARWAQSDETVRRESIDAIAKESRDLGRLIEELLLLARSDSGDSVVREPVDLAAIADELVVAGDRLPAAAGA